MLVQFTVENFLSFGEKMTFSMLADNGNSQHPAHVIKDDAEKTPPLLRAAALYGANGSGKSNLVKAMRFAQQLILNGTRGDQKIGLTPFKLGGNGQRPSRFEFIFIQEGVPYSYGFLVSAAQVVEEWLYASPGKQEVRYFERATSEQQQTTVEFGATFTGKGAKQKQFLEFVAQGTRPNQLFLTECRERNVTAVAPIIDWFEKVLVIISPDSQYAQLETSLYMNTQFAEFVSVCMRTAGTGVDIVRVEKMPLKSSELFPSLSETGQQNVFMGLQRTDRNHFALLEDGFGKRESIFRDEQQTPVLLQLKTQHSADDGRKVEFDVEEESEGTQRLMHLAVALFRLKERPTILILDELDRRLHPLLSRYFVEAALECAGINQHSQFIFTTHETHLLDQDLLRRDEIWFVEKDKGGASHLYSLAEFNIRPDLKIQKGYLNGRFGAIPFLGDACSLGLAGNEKVAAEDSLAEDNTQTAVSTL